MSYKILSLISIFLISLTASSFRKPDDVKWKKWEDAYESAKKNNKIVLVDFYTDWCGWCKRMDKDTYSQTEVQSLIHKHYEPVKLNPEKQDVTYAYNGKTYTGQQLKSILTQLSQTQFQGYPTTGFLIPQANQDIVILQSGYLNPQQFSQLLTAVGEKAKSIKSN